MEKTYKNTYNNSGYFFLLLFAFVFVAFFKSYFSIFPSFKSGIKSATVIHFHAAVSFTWLLLLIVQPLLIRYKKYKAHRIIGKFSYVLFPLIIASFIALMYVKFEDGSMYKKPLVDILYYFYFQILHTIYFIIFYTLAIINKYKNNIALHSGYMIATGLIFINPVMRRVLYNGVGVSFKISETVALLLTDVFIILLLVISKRNNINYKFYYIILMLFMLYQVPMFALLYVFYP